MSTLTRVPRSRAWAELAKMIVPLPELAPIITCLRDLDERLDSLQDSSALVDDPAVAVLARIVAVQFARDRALHEYCSTAVGRIRAHGLEGPEVLEDIIKKMAMLVESMPLSLYTAPKTEVDRRVADAVAAAVTGSMQQTPRKACRKDCTDEPLTLVRAVGFDNDMSLIAGKASCTERIFFVDSLGNNSFNATDYAIKECIEHFLYSAETLRLYLTNNKNNNTHEWKTGVEEL